MHFMPYLTAPTPFQLNFNKVHYKKKTNKKTKQNKTYPQQYMACDLLDTSFPVTIAELFAFSIIMLFGVVGNALIMILVYKRPELRTMMNYFIINMAASDFVFASTATPILMVEIATSSWQWYIDGTVGLIICKFSLFMERVLIAVSVQSLIWIALDRFVAVLFPLKVHLISSRIRALAIASTWIVAIGMKTLDLYMLELVEIGDRVICTQVFDTTEFSYRDYARVYTVLFHVVPLLLMTILYSIIAATLRGQNKALRRKEVHQRSQRKEGAIRMSFCIVAALNICVFPLISFYILLEYDIKISCSMYKAVLTLLSTLHLFEAIAVV